MINEYDNCEDKCILLADAIHSLKVATFDDEEKMIDGIKEMHQNSFHFPNIYSDKMPHSKDEYSVQERVVYGEKCGMNVLDLADLVQHAKRTTLFSLMCKAEDEDEVVFMAGLIHFQLQYGYHDGGNKDWTYEPIL